MAALSVPGAACRLAAGTDPGAARSTGFYRLQPQPLSPAAFAVSSLTQHAPASDLAGPPQQPEPSALPTPQAPDAGSTSSTRRAAALSPASSAAIERTCS